MSAAWQLGAPGGGCPASSHLAPDTCRADVCGRSGEEVWAAEGRHLAPRFTMREFRPRVSGPGGASVGTYPPAGSSRPSGAQLTLSSSVCDTLLEGKFLAGVGEGVSTLRPGTLQGGLGVGSVAEPPSTVRPRQRKVGLSSGGCSQAEETPVRFLCVLTACGSFVLWVVFLPFLLILGGEWPCFLLTCRRSTR